MESMDYTKQQLLLKKKQLLAEMLKQSARIRAATNEQELDQELRLRETILRQLQINDQAIAIRTQQLGELAKGQVNELELEIEALLKAVKFNNQAQILDLESQMTDLEGERKRLEKSNKVAGYFRPKTKGLHLNKARVKRPLPKGGYGQ